MNILILAAKEPTLVIFFILRQPSIRQRRQRRRFTRLFHRHRFRLGTFIRPIWSVIHIKAFVHVVNQLCVSRLDGISSRFHTRRASRPARPRRADVVSKLHDLQTDLFVVSP